MTPISGGCCRRKWPHMAKLTLSNYSACSDFTAESAEIAEKLRENLCELRVLCGKSTPCLSSYQSIALYDGSFINRAPSQIHQIGPTMTEVRPPEIRISVCALATVAKYNTTSNNALNIPR